MSHNKSVGMLRTSVKSSSYDVGVDKKSSQHHGHVSESHLNDLYDCLFINSIHNRSRTDLPAVTYLFNKQRNHFQRIFVIFFIFFATFSNCSSFSPSSSSSLLSSPSSSSSSLSSLLFPSTSLTSSLALNEMPIDVAISQENQIQPNIGLKNGSFFNSTHQQHSYLQERKRTSALQQHIKRQANNRQALERPYMRSIFVPSPYVTTPGPVFINFTRLLINRLNATNNNNNQIERKFIFIDKHPGSVKNTFTESTSGLPKHHQIPDPLRKKTLVKVKMITNGSKQTMLYDKSTTIAPDIAFTTSKNSENNENEVTTNQNAFFKSLTLEPIVDLENNLQKRSEFDLTRSTIKIKPTRINSKMSNNFNSQISTTTMFSILETNSTPITLNTIITESTTTPMMIINQASKAITMSPVLTTDTPATTIKSNDFHTIVTMVSESSTNTPISLASEPKTESNFVGTIEEKTINEAFNTALDDEFHIPSSSTFDSVPDTTTTASTITTTTTTTTNSTTTNSSSNDTISQLNFDEHRCYFDQELLCPGNKNDKLMCFGRGEINCNERLGENCRLTPGNFETNTNSMYFYCNYPLKSNNCRGVAYCEIIQQNQSDDLSNMHSTTPTNVEDESTTEGGTLASQESVIYLQENSIHESTKNPLKQNLQNSSTMSTLKVALISGLVAVGVLVIIAVSIVAFVSWQKLKVGPAGSSTVTLNDSESEYYPDKPTVICVNTNWNANRRRVS